MKIGYARVSTEEQRLDLQRDALLREGCATIFEEKITGTSHCRPVLNAALARLSPGDVLYIPPKTLHQVHGLSASISFNIDWHTPKSSLEGSLSFLQGAPARNIYYNFLIFLGLSIKIPSETIFKYYKTYLNYVS